MRKLFIYRVQNTNGLGPYRRWLMESMEDSLIQELDRHSQYDPIRLPPIFDTIGRWPMKDEICGFITLSQANRWFPSDLRIKLFKYGFRLSRVEVEEVTAVSDIQCFAIRKVKNETN